MISSAFIVKPHSPGIAEIRIKNVSDYSDKKTLTLLFTNSPATSPTQPLDHFIDEQSHDLVLLIDADALSDTVLEGAPYQIKIPELDLTGSVLWPLIPSKRSADKNIISHQELTRPKAPESSTPQTAPSPSLPKEEYIPSPPASASPSQMDTHTDDDQWHSLATPSTEKRRNTFFWVVGIIVLCALVGAALIWGMGLFSSPLHTPPKEALSSSKPKEASPSPAPQTTSIQSLETLSVPDVIAKAPSIASIGQEGIRRLNGHQKDDGVLLLEAAANKGDGMAMLALARLYDPVTFKPGGPVPSPDIRESAHYFQKAVQAQVTEAIQPRAVLHDYLQQQAQQGNMTAQLALKDFWP